MDLASLKFEPFWSSVLAAAQRAGLADLTRMFELIFLKKLAKTILIILIPESCMKITEKLCKI
jgi:hypothetical protein